MEQGIWQPNPSFEEVVESVLEKTGKKNISELELDQLNKLKATKQKILRYQRDSPIHFYKPYESRTRIGYKPQEAFHKSMAKIRLFIGGNRSGKSEGGIVEDVFIATGLHPFFKARIPNHGWIVSLDFPMSRDVAEEKLHKWLPPKMIKRWDTKQRVIYLSNGSTIGLRSCDQDIETFGGAAKDWIHFDEEPRGERGFAIYRECLMRTADTKGRIWFTLTPVSGISWTYDQIYERRGVENQIEVFEVESWENPHVDTQELKNIESLYDDKDEKDMRLKGKYVQFSGLVYKDFDSEVHVIDPVPIPHSVRRFRSIDHGLRNPTACLFAYVNEKDEIYVYDEYYETDRTIRENAEAIKTMTGNDKIEWTMIDPSTDNRDAKDRVSIRSDYAKYGIITRAMRTGKDQGIERVRSLLKTDPDTRRPKLFIYRNCYNTIKEIMRYRFKDTRSKEMLNKTDEPAKVNDHAMDALRYLVMSGIKFDLYQEDQLPVRKNWYK